MENSKETQNEKPKGNMIQNENREDDALVENSTGGDVKKVQNEADGSNPQITETNDKRREDNNQ